MNLNLDDIGMLQSKAEKNNITVGEFVAAGLCEESFYNSRMEELHDKDIKRFVRIYRTKQKDEFNYITSACEAVFGDLCYFPVAECSSGDKTVMYDDTWFGERTFGGNRHHEGTDIMASCNLRGVYPVVSVTDGVIEKTGWLKLGGYRIGIRSEHGGYFYYAHLASYAKDYKTGDIVKAGEIIGYMGDSGYGEEGTVGQFDVHLHFGIYINDNDGNEISINPYHILKALENNKKYSEY